MTFCSLPPSSLPSCSEVRNRSEARWASRVTSRGVISIPRGEVDRTPHFARDAGTVCVSIPQFYHPQTNANSDRHRSLGFCLFAFCSPVKSLWIASGDDATVALDWLRHPQGLGIRASNAEMRWSYWQASVQGQPFPIRSLPIAPLRPVRPSVAEGSAGEGTKKARGRAETPRRNASRVKYLDGIYPGISYNSHHNSG